jgi:hypothetical protein
MGQECLFHKLFSQNRLQTYLSNKQLEFGHEVYESEDYVMYNTIVEAVLHELVNDKIIVKQQKKSTPDNPEDKYEVTQNLDKICKDFRDSGLSF